MTIKSGIMAAGLVSAVWAAGAKEIQVGIYRPEPRETPQGIYLALQSDPDIAETRYVSTLDASALKGLDVLILPQINKTAAKELEGAREALRKWVEAGHGLLTTHDAVGYRLHPTLFPEIAKGIGHPFNRETGYGRYAVVTVAHPAMAGFTAPTPLRLAYFDQIILECGPDGVVLAREGIPTDGDNLITGEPVIVAGMVGKGRYVANGPGTGLNEKGQPAVPKGAELTLFRGLVRWLAGEGATPRTPDLGTHVSVVRAPEDDDRQRLDVFKRVEAIQAQALETWTGDWQKSSAPAPNAVALSGFKTPIELPARAVQASAYTAVAEGWWQTELRDGWRCRRMENTATNGVGDDGSKSGFERADFDDSDWAFQPVPKESRRAAGFFNGVIWYRRLVVVPPFEKGQRVILSFARCGIDTTVWVNGQAVGGHVGGSTPFAVDVTDAVLPGRTNCVAVRVFDIQGSGGAYTAPDGTTLNRNPYPMSLGHLWGEVTLAVKPTLYAVRTFVTPRLASSDIEVDAWLFNPGAACVADLTLTVQPAPPALATGAGKPSHAEANAVRLPEGVSHQTFRVSMPDPVLWDTANPFLYVLEIRNGADVLARERFGFREFKTVGPDFELNGKRTKLIATIVSSGTFDMSRRIETDDEGQFLTRYLLAVKGLNANTIYTMAAPHPNQFYDRCDELGFLVYADWNSAHSRFPNLPMAEGWSKGEREIESWMAERYNHPSAAVTSLGAELFESYTPKPYDSYNDLLNPAYRAIKAMDKQGRPVAASSGRGTWTDPDALTDLHDYHFYPGYLGGSWTDQAGKFRSVWLTALGQRPPLPVVQYEMDGGRVYNQDAAAMKDLLAAEQENGRIDRQRIIDLFQQTPANRMGMAWISALYGFRRYAGEIGIHGGWRSGAGMQIDVRKNVGQVSRQLGPLQAGYCPNTEVFGLISVTEDGSVPDAPRDWLHQRLGKGWEITDDLSKKRFVETEAYLTWKRVNSPRAISLAPFDWNVLAGATLTADVHCINDIDEPTRAWTARLVIRDAQGTVLDDRLASVGPVSAFKRKIVPYSFAVPETLKTGEYRIDLYLDEAGQTIADNTETFYVLGREDRPVRVTPATGLQVALYDTRAKGYKTGVATKDVLDQLQVPYTAVTDFTDIALYNVLIVGTDSLDETVRAAGNDLKTWLENGGRLLQFEQHVGGTIPYWRKLKLLSAAPHITAEIIESNHPIFAGMTWRSLVRWSALPDSRTPGDVYRLLLGPIDTDVLATGALGTPRNDNKNNQMALTETVLGKGRLVMSQMEATQRFGKDAAATRLIGNLLDYVCGDQLWMEP